MFALRSGAFALVLGGAIALAGCGGTSGPSKQTYVKRADSICASAKAGAAPLVRRLATAAGTLNAEGARKLAPTVKRLQAIGARYVSQLRSLDQPGGDHAAIERFLNPTATTVEAIGSAADALARGDSVTALGALQRIQSTASQANDAARAYGFRECGSVLTAG